MRSDQLVGEITRYAEDKKAAEVVELDVRHVLDYSDYFLVCSGNTGRQAKAIHDGILEGALALDDVPQVKARVQAEQHVHIGEPEVGVEQHDVAALRGDALNTGI